MLKTFAYKRLNYCIRHWLFAIRVPLKVRHQYN
jgi:hypothetical protein